MDELRPVRIWILDTEFFPVHCIDNYESIIWNSKYYEAGDFELYIPRNESTNEIFKESLLGYYVHLDDPYLDSETDNEYMVIENIKMEYDYEDGSYITITGRSLSSLLNRRTNWNVLVFNDSDVDSPVSIETVIHYLIESNITDPRKSASNVYNERTFNGDATFEWENNRIDGASTSLYSKINPESGKKEYYGPGILYSPIYKELAYDPIMVFPGDSIYTMIQSFCETYGFGFRIDHDGSGSRFKIIIYNGEDRTVYQYDAHNGPGYEFHVQYVTPLRFYSELGDIKSSSITAGIEEFKNIDRVGSDDISLDNINKYATGLYRRVSNRVVEYFLRENDQGTDNEIGGLGIYVGTIEPEKLDRFEYGETISVDLESKQQYPGYSKPTAIPQFHSAGIASLNEYYEQKEVETEVSENSDFKYKKDFNLGDMVTIRDEFGIEYTGLIIEVVRVFDNNGYSCYPKFKFINHLPVEDTLRTLPWPIYYE